MGECVCECHGRWQHPCSIPGGCGHLHEEPLRCKAGRRCTDCETLADGERVARPIPTGRDLCDACTHAAAVALRELPYDVLEIGQRIRNPSIAVRMRDPDMPTAPRVKKSAPLPFDEFGFTLCELITYELTVWAESVADFDGLSWDSDTAERCRNEVQVGRACELLGHRLATLIRLPVQQQRARSLTYNPADGHDPDTTTRDRGDFWANREGWEAAVRFIDLHERATKYIGRKPVGVIVPCPSCNETRLMREQHNDRVVCRGCRFELSDDEYDAFVAEALKSIGSLGEVVTRTQAAAMAGVKPSTVGWWAQIGYIRRLPSGGYRRVEVEEFLESRRQNAEFLTLAEAAAFADVKPGTISKWVHRGHIKHYDGGYLKAEIVDYMVKRASSEKSSEKVDEGLAA